MSAFPEISKIPFEGPSSKNPLAFRHYNPDEVVEGKSMRDHFRFAVAYWHTFRGTGSDPFGPGTCIARGKQAGFGRERQEPREGRLRVHGKARAPFYCFHDRDVAPEGATLAETNKNLDAIVKVLKEEQQRDRHQAAVGHGQPVQQSPLHARRRDQLQRRRLRLRRRPGEEGDGSHARNSAA